MCWCVQVTYKATKLLDDQVLCKGMAAGGLSDVPRELFHSCNMGQTLAQVLPSIHLPACAASAARLGPQGCLR